MLALLGDLENAGGRCWPSIRARSRAVVPGGFARRGRRGADAHSLARGNWSTRRPARACAARRRIGGLDARHVPARATRKGNYFTLAGRAPFSRLVYPVPEPGGLGVHLTLDLGGQAKLRPRRGMGRDGGRIEDYTVDPRAATPSTPRCAATGRRCPTARCAGLRRHPAQDQRPRRAGGGLRHPGPGAARRAGAGEPVRHRVARALTSCLAIGEQRWWRCCTRTERAPGSAGAAQRAAGGELVQVVAHALALARQKALHRVGKGRVGQPVGTGGAHRQQGPAILCSPWAPPSKRT
jgi:hypothetical protein